MRRAQWSAGTAEAMAQTTVRFDHAAAVVARLAARPEPEASALRDDHHFARTAYAAAYLDLQRQLPDALAALRAAAPSAAAAAPLWAAAAPLGCAIAALDAAVAAAAARDAPLGHVFISFAHKAALAAQGLFSLVERAAGAPGAGPPPAQVVASVYAAWRAALRAPATVLAAPLVCSAQSRAEVAHNASFVVRLAISAARRPALPGGEAAARRLFTAAAFRALLAPALPLLAERVEAQDGMGAAAVRASAQAWRECLDAAAGTTETDRASAELLTSAALELAREAPDVAAGLFEYAAAVARRAAALCEAAELEEAAAALNEALWSPCGLAMCLARAPGGWGVWSLMRCTAFAALGLRALGARATPGDPSCMITALEIAEKRLFNYLLAISPTEP